MTAATYTIERYLNRPDWLRGTHQSIGASAGARIVGLSGYGSPYSEWVRFTEPLVIDEPDDIQRWGLLLEPVILAEFVRQSGVKAEQLPPITVHRDNQRPYLHATLDAQADDGSPVELKTAHFAAAKIWKKECPLPYMVQMQHQIHVTGAAQGYIAVLKDGYEFAWHRVPRHQRFIDKLLKRLDYFWSEYVLKRQAPPTDYSEATAAALARKYPSSNGKAIELPAELQSLYSEYQEQTKQESSAKKRKAEIQNLLKERIGDYEYGSFGGSEGFKWAGDEGKRRFTRSAKCPEPVGCYGDAGG